MLIGAWKSFTELEDSITLDELFALYEAILDDEHEKFRRDAGLQGIEIPSMDDEQEQEQEPQPSEGSLSERVARRRAEEKGEDPNVAAGHAKFGEGVGYKLIGG